MRSFLLLQYSLLSATAFVWGTSSGCLDVPPESSAATARLVTAWDPLECGDPHRVVVELEDDGGAKLSAGTPCNIGGVTLDVSHLGSYHGRVYAWALDAPIRSITAIEVMIDRPIVHLQVSTPQ